MQRAQARLRDAIDGFFRGQHAARLSRMRDPSDDTAPRSDAWAERLASNEGADALAEVREQGELEGEEITWLAAHQGSAAGSLLLSRAERAARGRLAAATTPTGGRLSLVEELSRLGQTGDARYRTEASRSLESELLPLSHARTAALLRVEALAYVEHPRDVAPPEPGRDDARAPAAKPSGLLIVSAFAPEVLSPPRRDLPAIGWREPAQRFLEATDAAAEDAGRFLMRHQGLSGVPPWHALFHALRASDFDSEMGRTQRWLRVSVWQRGLGFEPELSARLRAEHDYGACLPVPEVALLDAPRDVRVGLCAQDFGLLSDLGAAAGASLALIHALLHAALPAELRWPLGAHVQGALAMLGALTWVEREQLLRLQGLSQSQVERIGRHGGTTLLLWARACIALALLPAQDEGTPAARLETACDALSRALRVQLEPGIVGVLMPDRLTARARALEALAGLALASGLRERFDADWFRNPRSAAVLRGLAQRGNRVSCTAACAELGQELVAAAPRALELVA